VSSDPITRILAELEKAGVRLVVVGGVAVVLHGHLRFTADLDLVVALDRDNVLAALSALKALGYRPRPPVPAEDFADPAIRAAWVRDKNMTVFSLWSESFPGTDVDLFAQLPIPFEDLEARAVRLAVAPLTVPVASIRDLIAMKRKAGRPVDATDIAALEKIELSLKVNGDT
jgi:hypothetical protein